MNIGSRLIQLRKKHGLSQLELSQRCGISQASIARIEADRQKNVTTDTLEKLAAALGVSPGKLLEEPVRVKEDAASYRTVRMLSVVELEKYVACRGRTSPAERPGEMEPSLSTDPMAVFLETTGDFAGAVSARSVLLLVEPSSSPADGDAVLLISREIRLAGKFLDRRPFFVIQPFMHGAEPLLLEVKKLRKGGIRILKIAEVREKY